MLPFIYRGPPASFADVQQVHEKRSNVHPLQLSNYHKPLLEFPPFRHNLLLQNTWDANDKNGRIKIILSEQLIGRTGNPSDLEFGSVNEIARFSFQHAPRGMLMATIIQPHTSNYVKEILEQAGVSWPIRNPLYFPSTAHSHPFLSHPPISYSISDSQEPKSPGKLFKSPFDRPNNPEPYARPNTAPMPPISQSSRRPVGDRGGHKADIGDDSCADSFGDPFNNTNMGDHRPVRRTSSALTTDIILPDLLLASPTSSKPQPGWYNVPTPFEHGKRKNSNVATRNGQGREKHKVAPLQEDQSSRRVEGASPPKGLRGGGESGTQRHNQTRGASGQHVYHAFSPKMGPMSIPLSTRPSAAAVARTASYLDLHAQARGATTQLSPAKHDSRNVYKRRYESPPHDHLHELEGKENHSPSEGNVTSPRPVGKRVPTPHPFLQDHICVPSNLKDTSADPNMVILDPLPQLPSLSRFGITPQQHAGEEASPTYIPTGKGGIKSRKEGLGIGSPAPAHQDVRHDQSLLLSLSAPRENIGPPDNQKVHVLNDAPTPFDSILNSDKPIPFVLGHRSRMNSMERVETQLFSALGEELNSFNENVATTVDCGMPSGFEDLDSPLAKRKRQGSLGGERGKSPNPKIMKDESIATGDQNEYGWRVSAC